VRAQYEAFIEDFAGVRALSVQACFRQQTLLVHAWRRFPLLDPDLPAELLPAGWPRHRAHDLFTGRHERWRDRALDYFAQLEGELEPIQERAA
jgi:phenylacetic acid degradation operon negative regulatory protein